MSEDLKIGICIVSFVVSAFAACFWLEAKACQTKTQSFQASSYVILGGCMVKVNDKWIPLANYREL